MSTRKRYNVMVLDPDNDNKVKISISGESTTKILPYFSEARDLPSCVARKYIKLRSEAARRNGYKYVYYMQETGVKNV